MRGLRHLAPMLLVLAVGAGCAGVHRDPIQPPESATTSGMPSTVPSTASSTVPPRPLTPTSSRPSPRPTCGRPRAAGTTVLALPGGRRALLTAPAGDDGHHRLGLVIGLPGYGETSEALAAQSRLLPRAEAAGILAVLPQGAGPAKSWNFSGTTGYDDVGFLAALLTRLTATECADPGRVVISGISDGGVMAAFAACALPGRFHAVVTVAASTDPRPGCRRLRILAVHGDADPVDPYGGGPDGRPGYPATPPALAAIAAWATLDGCRSATTTRTAPHIVTRSYPCGAQLVTVNGGGHTWPGGAPVDPSFGVTTREYDVTARILALL